MSYAIKDQHTGFYYTGKVTVYGYYHPVTDRARLFTTIKTAQQTIDAAQHHVIWPGGRHLVIVPIKVEEIR